MGTRRKSKYPDNAFKVATAGSRPRFSDSGGKVHDKASTAFYQVVELVFPALDPDLYVFNASASLPRLPDIECFYPTGMFPDIRVGTPEQQKAMTRLFLTVQKAVEDAHQSGIERGKSLLIQLAKGKITAKQLNDHTLEEDES